MRFAFHLLLASLVACTTVHAAPRPAGKTSGGQPAATFKRHAPMPSWAQPLADAPQTARSDALVVRLAETQVYVGSRHAYLVNQVIQANDRSALPEIGQYSIDYFPSYQKLSLHRVSILRKGKLIDHTASANVRLLDQETAASEGVYGGGSTARLLLDDVQIGDSLWITYTVEGSNPVFGGKYADRFGFEGGSPVELRRITFLEESGRQLRWVQAGDFRLNKVEPVVDMAGGLRRTRFEVRHADAVLNESAIPANYFPVQFLHVSEYKEWNEVARWASTLFPPVSSSASPQFDALVRQFEREPDAAAKAAAALQWVQDEIRYFSVSIGENSHRPQKPETVLKRRYGDCKDKTYLLMTLLRRLGIQADAVLVNSGAHRMPGRLPPSTLWFDHVVVQASLDGKTWLVDPTRSGEKGAIAKRPAVLPGGVGLLVSPESTGLLAIPDPLPELPTIERSEKLVLHSVDGPATLEVDILYRDSDAANARRYYRSISGNELKKELLAGHEKEYAGLALTADPQLVDSEDGSTYTVKAQFRLDSPVAKSDAGLAVAFETKILDSSLQIPDKVVRNFPLALPWGKYHARYHMEIVWPELTRAQVFAPAASAVDNPFFRAADELTFRGRTMRYSLDYRVKQDEVAAADVPEMQEKSKALSQFMHVTLRRNDGNVVSKELSGISLRDLDLVRWSVAAREMEKNQAVRKEVKPDEYCRMAGISYSIGLSTGRRVSPVAFVDAVAKKPEFKDHACAAVTAFKTGNFSDAARRFDTTNALADDHPFVPVRAWAAFYAGQQPAALAHMERYFLARASSGLLSSDDLASALSLYLRAGKAFPDFLIAAVPGDLGAWPRPVIAMQLGRITPAQLIERAEALSGDERASALNDAWFHVAQVHFARGDRIAGVNALRWYAPNGIVSTEQFAHALAELWQVELGDAQVQAALELLRAGSHAKAVGLFRSAAERQLPYAQYLLGMAYVRGKGVAKDLAQARHWLDRAAAAGSPDAMDQLAYMAVMGEGGPKDNKAASVWLAKAALPGHYSASNALGFAYRSGELGLPKDHGLAFKHFLQAAQMGNPRAQAMVAAAYRLGQGQPKDSHLAHYWAMRAAELGDPEGMAELGILTLNGEGTAREPKRALELFKRAAEGNSASAQLQLAQMFSSGNGVSQSADVASEWYQAAARNGSSEAQYLYGILYQSGSWGTIDHAAAHSWFKAAARNGELRAHAELARQYEYGVGTAKDMAAAERHLQLAGDKADYEPMFMKWGDIFRWGYGIRKNPAFAAELYRKAIARRDEFSMDALNSLADMYENGDGVPKDLDKAVAMYRESASTGFATAMYSLATLYERGLVAPSDKLLAYTYYGLALRHNLANRKFVEDAREKQEMLGARLPLAQKVEADAEVANWKRGVPLPGTIANGGGAQQAVVQPLK